MDQRAGGENKEMNKHTPGPWHYVPDGYRTADVPGDRIGSIESLDANGRHVWWICSVEDLGEPGHDDSEAEANAHLMEAAPEMFTVCQKLIELEARANDHEDMDWEDLLAEITAMARKEVARVER